MIMHALNPPLFRRSPPRTPPRSGVEEGLHITDKTQAAALQPHAHESTKARRVQCCYPSFRLARRRYLCTRSKVLVACSLFIVGALAFWMVPPPFGRRQTDEPRRTTDAASRAITPKPEWLLEDDPANPYPSYYPLLVRDDCPTDVDFNQYVARRDGTESFVQNWTLPHLPEELGYWQNSVNDKLGLYVFARSLGVRVPRIYFCTADGPGALDGFVPPPDANGFVVKKIEGFSSTGVYVFENGFGGAEWLRRRNVTRKDLKRNYRRFNVTKFYVEELVRGPIKGEPPFNYRFFMFNGVVGGVHVEAHDDTGDGGGRFCESYVDESFRPMAGEGRQHICVKRTAEGDKRPVSDDRRVALDVRENFAEVHKYPACKTFPRPKSWVEMVDTAKLLSRQIGIFMRVDLFENAAGEVILGEFTPYPNAGKYHCLVKDTGSGELDPCYLGRLWKDGNGGSYNVGEGGPIPPVPDFMKGWKSRSVAEQCKAVMEAGVKGNN